MSFLLDRGLANAEEGLPDSGSPLPAEGGTYAFLLRLDVEWSIPVGKRGTDTFPAGYCLYLGSAMKGLAARVGRHLGRENRLHWHIDFLMEYACPVGVWWKAGQERLECGWARSAQSLAGSDLPARGFGSSDCRCASHLVYVSNLEVADTFASVIEASGYWHLG